MTSVRQRLLANAGAITLGRGLSSVIQIITVPVLLQHWGTRLYGEWILLSAVPSYLAMSDIGFGNVAGNEMTMLVAAGKSDEALEVFQSVSLFITVVSAGMCILLAIGLWLFPIERWLQIRTLSVQDSRLILLLLVVSALLTLQEGLFWGCFRCVGKFAMGTMAKNVVMVGSFLGLVMVASLGAGPLKVALVVTLINAAGTLGLWLLLSSQIDWIRYGVRHARWSIIRRLASPAISFMSFPISNILGLQGILIVVGHVFGPVGVVTFNTARTISRTVLQAMQMVNSSVWPEISAAFGAGSLALVRKLHRKSCQVSILLCVAATLVIAAFGNRVWNTWTLGKLHTDPILLDLLLVQMLIGSFWYTSAVVPVAINRHQGIAKVILCGSVASLAVSYPLMRVDIFGLRGAALALIAGDVFTSIFVLKTSLRLAEDSLTSFCRSLLEVPGLAYRNNV